MPLVVVFAEAMEPVITGRRIGCGGNFTFPEAERGALEEARDLLAGVRVADA